MKVFELRSFGLDNLVPAERPDPQPGHGQVLVRVRAVSLNFRDLLIAKGAYNPKMALPRIPVSDGAGEVAAVGPGVTRVKVGDRVAATFFQDWVGGGITDEKARQALGGDVDGMLAEQVVLNQDGVVRFPDHLSFEEAATLPCAGLTAWNALFEAGSLRTGETVLALGTGGVSIFALQFAKLAGARVIITSGSEAKLQRAKQLGADAGVDYKAVPEWGDRVRELTGGSGVDYVVEVGGSGTLPQSLKAVRRAGMVAIIGILSGGGSTVSPVPVLMRNLRLQGIYVGSREMFEAMNRSIALHKLKPVIDRVFPFDRAGEALRHMEGGAHFGKVVVGV